MKIVAANRRAKFDLEIIDTVEAGLILTGQEVKSCRLGQVNLAGAYVSFLGGQAVLKQAKISAYKYAGPQPDYDPGRDRPLLIKKDQLKKLEAITQEKGMTVVPLEVHADRYIKILLGVGRGRKRLDKRARIREREVEKRVRMGREE